MRRDKIRLGHDGVTLRPTFRAFLGSLPQCGARKAMKKTQAQRLVFWVSAALTLSATGHSAYCQDTGAQIFAAQCSSCHQVTTTTSTPAGPSLKGVVGRPIASRSDFAYSHALKQKTGTWNDATLNAYLASPNKFAPGSNTKMPAITNPANRSAVIGFLKNPQGQ
jgi:cytochrome c